MNSGSLSPVCLPVLNTFWDLHVHPALLANDRVTDYLVRVIRVILFFHTVGNFPTANNGFL